MAAKVSFRTELKKYVTGLVTALIVTLIAFWLVVGHHVSGSWLETVLIVLALVQLGVQLTFFLHMGEEAKPRWRMTAFIFTSVMVLAIVVGSLWVMHNLNYNMSMSPEQMDSYMKEQAKKGF